MMTGHMHRNPGTIDLRPYTMILAVSHNCVQQYERKTKKENLSRTAYLKWEAFIYEDLSGLKSGSSRKKKTNHVRLDFGEGEPCIKYIILVKLTFELRLD